MPLIKYILKEQCGSESLLTTVALGLPVEIGAHIIRNLGGQEPLGDCGHHGGCPRVFPKELSLFYVSGEKKK